jgi:hypothetical protein
MRQDLLNLTPDDLATLTNRGVVKRAQRELEEAKTTADIHEAEDGTVVVQWSDGITCTLPHDTALTEAACSCPASGVCRHLIQAVLAYQIWANEQDEDADPELPQPWNPGDISDETLAAHYTKAALTRLRKQFKDSHVFELVRSVKPFARIHTLSCTVRFLVPGDPRYTACDCAETKPCSHVPLAIWAFRQLEDEAGLVETGHDQFETPTALLDELEIALADLLEVGFVGASELVIKRLRQLARRCRDAGLLWHAELLDEIGQEYEYYTEQNARFSAAHTAALMGELLIRTRATRNPTGAVPGIFVRGSANDVTTPISSTRLTGLGCGVELLKGVTRLAVYFQDNDSGRVAAIQRDFNAVSGAEPSSYWSHGKSRILGESSLGALGAQELLLKGGKLNPDSVFILGRVQTSIAPQKFAWENLRAPLLAENFAEIRARHAAQPPATLRPRRVGEDLQVCPIASVAQAIFDPYNQAVVALLLDNAGELMYLVHPFTSRGAEGVDTLLWHLQNRQIKFVCGRIRPGGIIAPLSLIFEDDGKRYMVQPWIDRRADDITQVSASISGDHEHSSRDPLIYYPAHVLSQAGELLLNGLGRANHRSAESWRLLEHEGHTLGFVSLIEPITALADCLAEKQHRLDWDWREAAALTLNVLTLSRFAQEELV